MALNTETGHNKNVTNLETLIIACTGFGAEYNPSNPSITIPVLTSQYTQAKAAIKDVKTTETPLYEVFLQNAHALRWSPDLAAISMPNL